MIENDEAAMIDEYLTLPPLSGVQILQTSKMLLFFKSIDTNANGDYTVNRHWG